RDVDALDAACAACAAVVPPFAFRRLAEAADLRAKLGARRNVLTLLIEGLAACDAGGGENGGGEDGDGGGARSAPPARAQRLSGKLLRLSTVLGGFVSLAAYAFTTRLPTVFTRCALAHRSAATARRGPRERGARSLPPKESNRAKNVQLT
ncbi:MAG: hypothetical protein VX670_12105, partial [Candidatus Latescibacterota bacterium]|nr:hypothetical protein [Candidatus Latescibacterota bacterium]